MFEWLNNNIGLALVILSVLGLVGGSLSAQGLTFKLKTAKGKVNAFLISVGTVGLLLTVADFLIN